MPSHRRPAVHALAASAVAAILVSPFTALASGPGVPNISWPENQLFEVIGRVQGAGAPFEHGTAVMHDGYVVIPFADNVDDGGIAFVDLSDPTDPRIVHSLFQADMREGHSLGFSYSYPGLYAVTQGSYGIQFWDWSDVTDPRMLSDMALPGIEPSDYSNGVWWLFWQAPYVYVAGSSRGLFVVDASDPSNPVLLSQTPTSDMAVTRAGAVFAVGNLLVMSMNDGFGLSTLDISDPANPVLLDSDRSRSQYSLIVNGDRAILAGTGANPGVQTFDLSDPSDIRFEGGRLLFDRGGYLVMQDEYAHVGVSARGYFKVDVSSSPFEVIGNGDLPEENADADFGSVVGNLAIIGDDHGYGTVIMPHQSAPDTTPPAVNMVNPRDGATGQALTSRIGLTFTDQVDLRTVNASTFRVEPVGGEPLAGKYSGQTGVVNFAPDAPLAPNTTYRVFVPAGGVKDVVGNATAATFESFFATGSEVTPTPCDPPLHDDRSNVGESVSFQAACTGGGLSYSWNFGDGTPSTPFSSSSAISHVFDAPGHFSVILTVQGLGRAVSTSTVQTVTYPLTARAPARSSSIVHDAGRNLVWVTNPDANTVTAIDSKELRKVAEIPVGTDPRTLALDGSGNLWIANHDDATLTVLDGSAAGTVLGTVELPRASRPYGIVASPVGGVLYATLEATGQLVRLGPFGRAVSATVDVGPSPRGVAVSHDGRRIFVSRFISPLDHGELVEVDAESFQVVRTVELALDPGPDTESSGRGVPNYSLGVTISPDGRRAWIPSKKDNTVRGTYLSGEALTFESTVRAIVSQVDLAANVEVLAARADLNNRALPSSVTFNELGDYAYVTTLGSNTVDVLDSVSGEEVASIENVGLAPLGSVLDGSGRKLFVHNYMSRDVAVHDVSDVGGGNDTPRLALIDTVANELLRPRVLKGKQIFYDAADDRMSRDDYISCAVCHLDGGSDERVWDFTDRGEGLRNTVSLRGRAGMGHGPVHWSANFDEIQDFEHDIRGPFGGTGFLSDADFGSGSTNTPLGDPKEGLSADLDALAAYVASLTTTHPSPDRRADGGLTAAAIAGRALFESEELACASCHVPNRHTDSSLCEVPFLLHDVGTIKESSGGRLGGPLTGIDTPTLNGVWESAPYLHDGSAATLMDVITAANAGDAHGATSQLDATQRSQLVAYLRQIESPPGTPRPCDAGCGATLSSDATQGSGRAALLLVTLAVLMARRRGASEEVDEHRPPQDISVR